MYSTKAMKNFSSPTGSPGSHYSTSSSSSSSSSSRRRTKSIRELYVHPIARNINDKLDEIVKNDGFYKSRDFRKDENIDANLSEKTKDGGLSQNEMHHSNLKGCIGHHVLDHPNSNTPRYEGLETANLFDSQKMVFDGISSNLIQHGNKQEDENQPKFILKASSVCSTYSGLQVIASTASGKTLSIQRTLWLDVARHISVGSEEESPYVSDIWNTLKNDKPHLLPFGKQMIVRENQFAPLYTTKCKKSGTEKRNILSNSLFTTYNGAAMNNITDCIPNIEGIIRDDHEDKLFKKLWSIVMEQKKVHFGDDDDFIIVNRPKNRQDKIVFMRQLFIENAISFQTDEEELLFIHLGGSVWNAAFSENFPLILKTDQSMLDTLCIRGAKHQSDDWIAMTPIAYFLAATQIQVDQAEKRFLNIDFVQTTCRVQRIERFYNNFSPIEILPAIEDFNTEFAPRSGENPGPLKLVSLHSSIPMEKMFKVNFEKEKAFHFGTVVVDEKHDGTEVNSATGISGKLAAYHLLACFSMNFTASPSDSDVRDKMLFARRIYGSFKRKGVTRGSITEADIGKQRKEQGLQKREDSKLPSFSFYTYQQAAIGRNIALADLMHFNCYLDTILRSEQNDLVKQGLSYCAILGLYSRMTSFGMKKENDGDMKSFINDLVEIMNLKEEPGRNDHIKFPLFHKFNPKGQGVFRLIEYPVDHEKAGTFDFRKTLNFNGKQYEIPRVSIKPVFTMGKVGRIARNAKGEFDYIEIERSEVQDLMNSGEVNHVFTQNTEITGFDVPCLMGLSFLRTSSKVNWKTLLQALGRLLRLVRKPHVTRVAQLDPLNQDLIEQFVKFVSENGKPTTFMTPNHQDTKLMLARTLYHGGWDWKKIQHRLEACFVFCPDCEYPQECLKDSIPTIKKLGNKCQGADGCVLVTLERESFAYASFSVCKQPKTPTSSSSSSSSSPTTKSTTRQLLATPASSKQELMPPRITPDGATKRPSPDQFLIGNVKRAKLFSSESESESEEEEDEQENSTMSEDEEEEDSQEIDDDDDDDDDDMDESEDDENLVPNVEPKTKSKSKKSKSPIVIDDDDEDEETKDDDDEYIQKSNNSSSATTGERPTTRSSSKFHKLKRDEIVDITDKCTPVPCKSCTLAMSIICSESLAGSQLEKIVKQYVPNKVTITTAKVKKDERNQIVDYQPMKECLLCLNAQDFTLDDALEYKDAGNSIAFADNAHWKHLLPSNPSKSCSCTNVADKTIVFDSESDIPGSYSVDLNNVRIFGENTLFISKLAKKHKSGKCNRCLSREKEVRSAMSVTHGRNLNLKCNPAKKPMRDLCPTYGRTRCKNGSGCSQHSKRNTSLSNSSSSSSSSAGVASGSGSSSSEVKSIIYGDKNVCTVLGEQHKEDTIKREVERYGNFIARLGHFVNTDKIEKLKIKFRTRLEYINHICELTTFVQYPLSFLDDRYQCSQQNSEHETVQDTIDENVRQSVKYMEAFYKNSME